MDVEPGRRLRDSARAFLAQPFLSLSLGGAIVLAIGASCWGFGLIAAPWFLCELIAAHVGAATGERPERSPSWLWAGLLMLGAVVLVASTAWLSALAFTLESPPAQDSGLGTLEVLLLFGASALIALSYILPLTYAPAILIDRGGDFASATFESARIVAEQPLGHYVLSVLSHLVQGLPVVCAALIAGVALDPEDGPLAVLAAVPLLAVSIPIGQGAIVAVWIRNRPEPPPSRAEGRPIPRRLAAAIAAIMLAPVVSTMLLGASLVRPSTPRLSRAPEGVVLIDQDTPTGMRADLTLRDTALVLRVADETVSVVASDGGGAGAIPIPHPITRIRAVRIRDTFAIELHAGGEVRCTWIDRAGVRLDDGLGARLLQRADPWVWLLVLGLVFIPVALGGRMAGLGRARKRTLEGNRQAIDPIEIRLAWRTVLLTTPVALAALAAGVAAVML